MVRLKADTTPDGPPKGGHYELRIALCGKAERDAAGDGEAGLVRLVGTGERAADANVDRRRVVDRMADGHAEVRAAAGQPRRFVGGRLRVREAEREGCSLRGRPFNRARTEHGAAREISS